MQSVAVFVALLAAVSAANLHVVPQTVVPQYNGAVVTSQRVGNNFAYSVQTPGVQQVYTSGVGYPTVGATQVVAKNGVVASPLAYNLGYSGLGYSGLYNGYNGVYNGYNGVYNGYNGLYNGYNGVYPYGAYNGLGNVVVA